MDILPNIKRFEWDEWNIHKNWLKHRVSYLECEEVFFNEPLIIQPDKLHSDKEPRYYGLGKTNRNRLLFIVFTVRKDSIRIISARDMNNKEKRVYQ
jgi:uncharacterized protein